MALLVGHLFVAKDSLECLVQLSNVVLQLFGWLACFHLVNEALLHVYAFVEHRHLVGHFRVNVHQILAAALEK